MDFLFSNFFNAITRILDYLLTAYYWIVIVATLITWVNPDPYNPIVRTLRAMTEPVFYRVRRWLPFTVVGGLDLSPVVVLLFIWFLQLFAIPSLYQFVLRM